MHKAVSRGISRGQEDPAERFNWVDVYLGLSQLFFSAIQLSFRRSVFFRRRRRILLLLLFWGGGDKKEKKEKKNHTRVMIMMIILRSGIECSGDCKEGWDRKYLPSW